MAKAHNNSNRTKGGALDIKPEHVTGHITDGELKGKSDVAELDPDGIPRLEAVQEALKQKNDSQILKSDFEDADIRNSAPGIQEQD